MFVNKLLVCKKKIGNGDVVSASRRGGYAPLFPGQGVNEPDNYQEYRDGWLVNQSFLYFLY
jgi:hypothetical protein